MCWEVQAVCACARGDEIHNAAHNNEVLFVEPGTVAALSEALY
jgi:hypothetical protein